MVNKYFHLFFNRKRRTITFTVTTALLSALHRL